MTIRVAINDLGDPAIHAHLLKFDSVHCPLGYQVNSSDNES